jgi:methyl-accepting chemotaxis protein
VITQHVERSQKEQAQGNKLIGTSIEAISQMVHNLHRAQRTQTRSMEESVAVAQKLKERTREHERKVAALSAAAERWTRTARREG